MQDVLAGTSLSPKMASVVCLFLLLSALAGGGFCGCSEEDWSKTIGVEGLSRCSNLHRYITAFNRAPLVDRNRDGVNNIKMVRCCDNDPKWSQSYRHVMNADWSSSLERNRVWSVCPEGYFLSGLSRGSQKIQGLGIIEEARCTKPDTQPNRYKHCYDEDISTKFDNNGWTGCSNPNYFVVGLYRGDCEHLHCLDKLRCCSMVTEEDALDEVYRVKTFIMDKTLVRLAELANALGYGWCSGCGHPFVGEGFLKMGDSWEAQYKTPCSGHMHTQRLKIVYKDWTFATKDITYGKPEISEIAPETVDSGTVVNSGSSAVRQVITRQENVVRSVTHTKTTHFKNSMELGLEITYTPPGVGVKNNFKFGFESGQSTTTTTGQQDYKIFKIDTEVPVPPRTTANWKLLLFKTLTTVSYTSIVIAKFSVEFQGFLRWGDGYYGPNTNYHYQHRGSGKRPTFNYKFGDSSTPFYVALKKENDRSELPWMWNDMKNSQPYVKDSINYLINENLYVFRLTGKFDDVSGKRIDMTFDNVIPESKNAVELPHAPGVATRNARVAKL